MRVLVVHNAHRSGVPSGQDVAVEQEAAFLRGAGVEVESYIRSNDEIESFGPRDWIALPARLFYSRADIREVRRLVDRFRPDVMHVHNPWPLISPWVVRVARDAGVPVVHSVHDYSHVCATGTFFRLHDNEPCVLCKGRTVPLPAIRHACYHGSRTESAALALAMAAARPTWRLVDRFLAVSDLVARYLVDFGVPSDRIVVKPNLVPDPGPPSPPGDGFVFAGRLRAEKGVSLMLEAWRRSGLGASTKLTIAGDGPERRLLEGDGLTGVRYVGAVSRDEVGALMAESRAVLMPSIWDEPFGLTTVEAFARARPVIATRFGASRDLVDDTTGWLVAPDVDALAAAMVDAASGDVGARAAGARRRYEERFTPTAVVAQLVGVYREVSGGD